MQVATNDIYSSTSSSSDDDVSSISSRNSQQMTNYDMKILKVQDTEKIIKITEAQEKFDKNQN